MTNEEWIAITKDVALAALHNQGFAGFPGYTLDAKQLSGSWRYMVRSTCGGKNGEWMSDPFVALFEYRQKLAAEREAAMTPNERKYKAALEEIVEACGYRRGDGSCELSTRIAKQALKETP